MVSGHGLVRIILSDRPGRIEDVLPASYRPLLTTPSVARALGTSLLARVGQPAGALAVTLLVVERTGSYASVGLVSACWVVGTGIGSLLWSRLVDRGRSVRAVLLGTALLSTRSGWSRW